MGRLSPTPPGTEPFFLVGRISSSSSTRDELEVRHFRGRIRKSVLHSFAARYLRFLHA